MFSSVWITHALLAGSFSEELRKEEEEEKNRFLYFNCKFGWTETDSVLYPNDRYLLVFLARLPVSTASAARNFSQLSRIKSYCRFTMKQNSVAAYIHKDLDINRDEILKLYRQMNSRGFDFDVWIWNINVINRDIKNRLTTHLAQA